MITASSRSRHAVVIGAGIAGLAAARALSETFDQVTIVERDHLPATPVPRPGVPQGRHAHGLAARGRQVLETLFPGLGRELEAEGAPTADFCRQARLHLPAGVPPPIPSQVVIQPVSRPLLETVLRRRVAAIPGVRIIDGCAVTGLRADTREVTGVQITRRTVAKAGGDTATIAADLIADAGGRSSHLPGWLTAIGLPRPGERAVDARVGYASRAYHTEPGVTADWRALFELPRAPHLTRGCSVLQIEDHLLLVTLQGAAGDHPPGDHDGFERFAKSLACDLTTVVGSLRPAGGVSRYARSAAHRRLYHRLRAWPDGLIALGDSACTFNPLYAQGMTVALLEAQSLRDLLGGTTRRDLRGFSAAFQRRVGRITFWPWMLSSLADRAWTETSPLVRAAHRYLSSYQDLAVEDATMFHDLARVTNLLAHPATFVQPRHLARILHSQLRTTSRRFGAHLTTTRRNGTSGPPAPGG
ncbi:NAD(P)/FAD-dependent oxidoreductase [Streptosporangium sp. NPDC004631]